MFCSNTSFYRNNLNMRCDEGDAALLEVTPNVTWPDVVYYHSYTTPYMGWKIHIVDNFRRKPSFGSANKAGTSCVLAGVMIVLFTGGWHS